MDDFEQLQRALLLKSYQRICVDSRLAEENMIFFALPGANVDGHQFLSQVASKGASAAVVSQHYQGESWGLKLFKVSNVLLALQALVKKKLAEGRQKIVAVTGSFGKTTTKDFIATLLKSKYTVASTPGNLNSQIGLPLAIFNHTEGNEDILILEMGMSHPGNLLSLVEMATPDIALIASVALVHAANFDRIEEISLAKAEIFSHPKTQLGIFPLEIPIADEVQKVGICQKLTFSTISKKGHYFLERKGDGVHIYEREEKVAILPHLPVVGEHNLHNFLAAISVARSLNFSWEEVRTNYHLLKLPERRLQFVEKNDVLFVNDSYNASELTVKAALRALPQPKRGARKIAVIGEMLELGKFSDQCHSEVGEFALNYVDQMFCHGPLCEPIYTIWKKAGRPVVWENERSVLLEILRSHLQAGDVVLLKASRSKELWKILEEI